MDDAVTGVIFDSKEFSVNDGPGVRETVFFKGCPLRCNWCHNPEGWDPLPQLMVRGEGCTDCGACRAVCTHDPCIACGDCVPVCPGRLRCICGERLTARELANRLLQNAEIYAAMGGGVTFSGGEPLMQPEFLLATMRLLGGMHKAVETCGYAAQDVFADMMRAADLIMMDVKVIDPEVHQAYTGVSNSGILKNLVQLTNGDVPFIIRIPLIPDVSDTRENFRETAALLQGAKQLQYVELLPYNRLAGAKYGSIGMQYQPVFDTERPVRDGQDIFREYGIESRLM